MARYLLGKCMSVIESCGRSVHYWGPAQPMLHMICMMHETTIMHMWTRCWKQSSSLVLWEALDEAEFLFHCSIYGFFSSFLHKNLSVCCSTKLFQPTPTATFCLWDSVCTVVCMLMPEHVDACMSWVAAIVNWCSSMFHLWLRKSQNSYLSQCAQQSAFVIHLEQLDLH